MPLYSIKRRNGSAKTQYPNGNHITPDTSKEYAMVMATVKQIEFRLLSDAVANKDKRLRNIVTVKG